MFGKYLINTLEALHSAGESVHVLLALTRGQHYGLATPGRRRQRRGARSSEPTGHAQLAPHSHIRFIRESQKTIEAERLKMLCESLFRLQSKVLSTPYLSKICTLGTEILDNLHHGYMNSGMCAVGTGDERRPNLFTRNSLQVPRQRN
jgi:hypothetical protein